MAGGTQIFVRNREGKVFGPIEPSTVELLIEGGVLQGLLQVSTDGERYALPFRFPELRDYFPRHLWGDDSRQEVQLDQEGPAPVDAGATGGSIAASLFGAGAEEVAADSSDEPLGPGDPQSAPEAPPVLTTARAEPSAPVPADPIAPPPPAVRTPTGTFRAPPVLSAAPVEPRRPLRQIQLPPLHGRPPAPSRLRRS